jgi:hypothetical protein
VATVQRDAARHILDGPAAQDSDAATFREAGSIIDRQLGGGQDICDVEETLVQRSVGHLDVGILHLRGANAFGLAPSTLQ